MKEIEKIWSEYHKKLFAFIKKQVNEEDAKDILQDVFIKTQNKIETLTETTRLENWLFQITRNSIIDYYRSNKNVEMIPEWIGELSSDDFQEEKKELASCLSPMIKKLPDKYRTAINLSEIEGKNQQEIAQLEQISLSGAKSRVQRGRLLLKDMLHDCCTFTTDKYNGVVTYEPKDKNCNSC